MKVYPPLHIFTTMSNGQIGSSFVLENEEFEIKNAKYDATNQQFNFTVKIVSYVHSDSFALKFDPREETVSEFFATPNVTVSMPYDFSRVPFYSATVLSLTYILRVLCFVTVICVWVSFLCGALSRNVFGVEALFVVQFAWTSFLWMRTPFLFTFFSLVPLKFSFGYNLGGSVSKEESANQKVLFAERSEMSDSVFVNVFGFCFTLISLSLLLSFFLGVIYKLSKQSNIQIIQKIKHKFTTKQKT